MELKKIEIENFRGIKNQKFKFNNQFNVIIGENAVGKTSLIEAIVVALGGFVKGLNYRNGRSITKEDIRIESYHNEIVRSEVSTINATALFLEKIFSWSRKRFINSELNDLDLYTDVYNYGKYLANESKSGRFTTLPLISYYGTGRLMKENDSLFNPETTSQRIDGYNKALNPNSNYKMLLSWFKANDVSVYKSGKSIDVLKSIKRAVRNSFDEIKSLYYDKNNQLLSILLRDNSTSESMPVASLSDGQRNLIGLIGDIALRCILLNPFFGDSAHEKTPGIILIDELDLHLHPNWQKKIVGILKKTFPKMQFIATTHSPFIVQSIKRDELILLDENIVKDIDPFRKSIEDIAENEMDVKNVQRSKLFIEMEDVATEYFNLIEKNNKSRELFKYEKRLNELEEYFSDDPAFVALLKIERKIQNETNSKK